MMKLKIDIKINNFININHKKNTYICLIFLPRRANKQFGFSQIFYCYIISIVYIIFIKFSVVLICKNIFGYISDFKHFLSSKIIIITIF